MSSHPGLIDEQTFAAFLAELVKGATLHKAALKAGWRWRVMQKRIMDMADEGWPELFQEAWQERQAKLEEKVDDRVEALVMKDDPAPSTVALWAKRFHPGYREKTQLEVSGPGGSPIPVAQRSMVIDAGEVLRILQEAGVADGSPELAAGPALLPARTGTEAGGVPAGEPDEA